VVPPRPTSTAAPPKARRSAKPADASNEPSPARATRPAHPWLRVHASPWWTRVLLAAGANLGDTYLHSTDLRGANLSSANLFDTSLRDTKLSGAKLVAVVWSERTRWPSEEMAAGMRARSEPLGGGCWRVAGSGNTDADIQVPTLPVG
jgi:hypothetical protein